MKSKISAFHKFIRSFTKIFNDFRKIFYLSPASSAMQERIDSLRRLQVTKSTKFMSFGLGLPLVLVYIPFDIDYLGFKIETVILRLLFIPICFFSNYLYRFDFVKRHPSIPMLINSYYIFGYLLYFISISGYSNSRYYEGLGQVLFGAMVIPFTAMEFYSLAGPMMLCYLTLITVVSGHGASVLLSRNVQVMLGNFFISCGIYYVISRTRFQLLRKNLELEDHTKNQEITIKNKVEALRKSEIQVKYLDELNTFAAQISHDIRSPLAAFSSLEEEIASLPEETRTILRSAVNRIQDIANSLLEKNRTINKNATSSDHYSSHSTTEGPPISIQAEDRSVHLVSSLLDQLITEKRIQFRSKIGLEIEARLAASSYGHFALIQAGEFKRVISNLINNSVEALGDTGRVTVCLTGTDTSIQIEIQDNGKGIPKDILPKLMKRGETHGKAGGSGLGLYHAKKTLEGWEGSLSLSSTAGVGVDAGTIVTLTLPRASSPDWFVPSINLVEGSAVVVLDDDSFIHQIWQSRMAAVAPLDGIQMIHFSTSKEVKGWVSRAAGSYEVVLYLFDYELLVDKMNGLDLIEALRLQESAILVTSRYEEAAVRERCEKLGVKLLPKGMAGFVPIVIQASKNNA